jgi:hypothetical protein
MEFDYEKITPNFNLEKKRESRGEGTISTAGLSDWKKFLLVVNSDRGHLF